MSISFNVLSDEYKFGFGISDLKICDENCKQVNISNIASEHLLSKLGFHMDGRLRERRIGFVKNGNFRQLKL